LETGGLAAGVVVRAEGGGSGIEEGGAGIKMVA